MGIADTYLAEVDAVCEEWDREDAVALEQSLRDVDPIVRGAELLAYATHPVIPFMINFMLDRWPGIDTSRDADLAALAALSRRRVVLGRAAGVDGGMADLNLAVLNWLDAQIQLPGDPAFASLVRERVDGLLDAARRGRQRGLMLRRRSEAAEEPSSSSTSIGWLLRHPSDHYFRSARANTSDCRLGALLDGQIDLLASSYERLASADFVFDQAELMMELEVLSPVVRGWTEPVATVVLATHTPSARTGERVGLRLVADPNAKSFNGSLVSIRGGERWLIYAHRLADGTVVPADGTRRTAARRP